MRMDRIRDMRSRGMRMRDGRNPYQSYNTCGTGTCGSVL